MKNKFLLIFIITALACPAMLFAQSLDDKVLEYNTFKPDTDDATIEDFQKEKEIEPIKDVEKKKVSASFNFGNIQFYKWKRAVNFFSDYFGWYPEILRFFDVTILPSGIKNMGVTISGIDFFGYDSSFNFNWGGGVEATYFQRDKDGRNFIYHRDPDYWDKQAFLDRSGLDYTTKEIDRAYAQWGLNYRVNFKFGEGNDLAVALGYNGTFHKYLQDYKDESTNWLKGLSDPASEMYTPDREMSLINRFNLNANFSHRTNINQRFTHGLFNEIGVRFNLEISPDVFNPSLTDEYLPKRNADGQILYDQDGKILYSQTRQYTADYYKVQIDFFARRKLFDISPDRKSVLLAGYVRWGSTFRYTDRLGYVGYIPLDIRMGIDDTWGKQAYSGNTMELILQLPQIKVEDLKGWSSPEVNSDWAKVEEWFGGIVSSFGMKPNYSAWNNTNIIEPELRFVMGAYWSRETDDGLNRRIEQLFIDSRESMSIDFRIDLNIRVFDVLNLGLVFEFQLEKPRWDYFWFRLG